MVVAAVEEGVVAEVEADESEWFYAQSFALIQFYIIVTLTCWLPSLWYSQLWIT